MLFIENLSIELIGVVGITIATLGFTALRRWKNYQKYRSLRNLPGPSGHWLFGILPKMIAAARDGQLIPLALKWHREFGDIFVIWNFGKPDLVINNPYIIQNILLQGQKEETFVRGGFGYTAYADVFGVHLGNQIGEDWQWRRKAWTPAFASSRFQSKFNIIEQASFTFIAKIKHFAEKEETVKVDPLFLDYTMSIIAYFLIGVPLDRQKDVILPILEPEKVTKTLAVLEKQVLLQGTLGSNWLKYLPIRQNRACREAKKYLTNFLKPRIDLAFKLAKNQSIDEILLPSNHPIRDSMATLMAADPKYTPELLSNGILAGLFAGHDTTSHTLSFAMGELALNPTVFQKARKIVDLVMEKDLNVESLKELIYVEAIFRETMRLHPTAAQLSVVAARNTTIKNIEVPKDTLISLNLMTAGRNSDMYSQPLEFQPERWLNDLENGRSNLVLFGFSLGAHYCLGAPLAILEATVILSLLIYNFDWDLVNGRSSLEELNQNMTVFAKDGIPIKFKLRQFAPQPVST